jgi:hypothetical protein
VLSFSVFSVSVFGEGNVECLDTTPCFISALYGAVLVLAAIAYYILQTLIVAEAGGAQSRLAAAIGKDWKGKLSPVCFIS